MNPPGNADLFRLVYRSRSAIEGTREEVRQTIDAIVAVSRRRNAEAGVTGALMFTRLFFVQALEGPTAAIEAIFDRICCDLRHSSVEVVECGPVLGAVFGEWPMSHLVPDADAEALLDQVEHETELADAAAAAMKLMAALMRPEQRLDAPAQQSAA